MSEEPPPQPNGQLDVDQVTKMATAIAAQALAPEVLEEGVVAPSDENTQPPSRIFGEGELHGNPDARLPAYLRPSLWQALRNRLSPAVSYDRFGNRVFVSPDQAYHEPRDGESKAALVLTREGQEWVQENRGILTAINKGLVALSYPSAPGQPLPDVVDLGNDRTMRRMIHVEDNKPKQSEVYLLEVNGQKFVVKTPQVRGSPMTQPYIREMLQTQQLGHDLASELRKAKVETPVFLFATHDASCTRYVEGVTPDPDFLEQRIDGLKSTIYDYFARRRRGIWKGTAPDMMNVNNFILRADDTLVCIDPFNPVAW